MGKLLLATAAIFCIAVGSFIVYNWYHPVRTGCDVEITFSNTCGAVQNEINSRVRAQHTMSSATRERWHDPHYNGTYRFTKTLAMHYQLEHISNSGGKTKHIDVIDLKFTAPSTEKILSNASPSLTRSERKTCHVKASSWSKDFSLLDFGTNFCNIYNLYCQSKDCHPITPLSFTYKVGKCAESDVQKCSSRTSV